MTKQGIEFVSCNGYVNDSSYIGFIIKNGKQSDGIGDQLWISEDGTELEITDMADSETINDAADLFERSHRRAFIGALRRMGVEF